MNTTRRFDEWCVIGRDGFVIRIGSESAARQHADACNRDYPHDAPHEAIRLVSLDEAERIVRGGER